MHTFVKAGTVFNILFVGPRGADVVCAAETEIEAMAVTSYLNGGGYPPMWNPPYPKE